MENVSSQVGGYSLLSPQRNRGTGTAELSLLSVKHVFILSTRKKPLLEGQAQGGVWKWGLPFLFGGDQRPHLLS